MLIVSAGHREGRGDLAPLFFCSLVNQQGPGELHGNGNLPGPNLGQMPRGVGWRLAGAAGNFFLHPLREQL